MIQTYTRYPFCSQIYPESIYEKLLITPHWLSFISLTFHIYALILLHQDIYGQMSAWQEISRFAKLVVPHLPYKNSIYWWFKSRLGISPTIEFIWNRFVKNLQLWSTGCLLSFPQWYKISKSQTYFNFRYLFCGQIHQELICKKPLVTLNWLFLISLTIIQNLPITHTLWF